jgi:hypothetical protein
VVMAAFVYEFLNVGVCWYLSCSLGVAIIRVAFLKMLSTVEVYITTRFTRSLPELQCSLQTCSDSPCRRWDPLSTFSAATPIVS